MILRVEGVVRRGPAIEAENLPVDAETLVRSLRSDDDTVTGYEPPSRIHEYVGLVENGMSLDLRAALACAARSRGHETPADDRIADLSERLSDEPVPAVDLAAARRRVAAASGEEEALRERVAALRGRIAARREMADGAPAATERLREATGRLAEVETERVAAEQALVAARRASREHRDERERRLRLADRLANAEREARRTLTARVADAFAEHAASAPGSDGTRRRPAEFAGDPVTAALAVARIAEIESPLVLDCRRFESAAAARDWLDAPAIRL